MNTELHPTLWRTCRALANGTRLRLLEAVIRHPDQPVGALAARTGVSETLASRYLRALNARGLIQAYRHQSWVYYRATADRTVPSSVALLGAIKRAIMREHDSIETMFRLVTAFTHPRRVAIIHELRNNAMNVTELRRHTRISQPAMERHMRKLRSRHLVVFENRAYRLSRPSGALARTLLRLASGERTRQSQETQQ